MNEFIYTLLSFLPFTLCLVWLAIYLADFRKASLPKRFLTLFVLACTLLYFCHAWFFMTEDRQYGFIDGLYLFCNLTVYPLFYCYLILLTKEEKLKPWMGVILFPGLIFAILAYFTGGDAGVLNIAKAIFAIEVVLVAVLGLQHLSVFNKAVHNYYSDPEGKTLQSTSYLLIAFVATSVLSTIANIIGRDVFLHSALLAIPSLAFTAMLFAIFYVSSGINFSAGTFRKEVEADDKASREASPDKENSALEEKIGAVMEERKLFLVPGLKISDVALAVGSNRTYVSNAINNAAGMSFTDYVNSRRVEYAKSLILASDEKDEISIAKVATDSGFASFTSFYRAFVKFEGMSPTAWTEAHES